MTSWFCPAAASVVPSGLMATDSSWRASLSPRWTIVPGTPSGLAADQACRRAAFCQPSAAAFDTFHDPSVTAALRSCPFA